MPNNETQQSSIGTDYSGVFGRQTNPKNPISLRHSTEAPPNFSDNQENKLGTLQKQSNSTKDSYLQFASADEQYQEDKKKTDQVTLLPLQNKDAPMNWLLLVCSLQQKLILSLKGKHYTHKILIITSDKNELMS